VYIVNVQYGTLYTLIIVVCPQCNVLQVGGVAGSLASGVISDMRIMNHRKDLTCLLFSLVLLPTYALLSITGLPDTDMHGVASALSNTGWLSVCMLVVGIGASGPKTLIGLMVRNFVPMKHMGLAGGLLGFIGQIGGALAGSGMGIMLQTRGWVVFFPMLLTVAVMCTALILAFMWYANVRSVSIMEKKTK